MVCSCVLAGNQRVRPIRISLECTHFLSRLSVSLSPSVCLFFLCFSLWMINTLLVTDSDIQSHILQSDRTAICCLFMVNITRLWQFQGHFAVWFFSLDDIFYCFGRNEPLIQQVKRVSASFLPACRSFPDILTPDSVNSEFISTKPELVILGTARCRTKVLLQSDLSQVSIVF